jgi:hydrogenase expression/formation protein HypE
LNKLVAEMLGSGAEIHCMRDPTRGGLASTLNEFASSSSAGMRIDETSLPVHRGVRAACEMLGFDPLYVANEGKLVAVVAARWARELIDIMHKNKYGKEAAIIGEVVSEHPGRVVMQTRMGASRIVDMLAGEQLPRIC